MKQCFLHKNQQNLHPEMRPWGFLVIFLYLFIILSCSRPQTLHKTQWIMGTVVDITWIGSAASEKTVKQAFDAIKSVDIAMNPAKAGSELFRINAQAGKEALNISPTTCRVIREGLRIGKETKGAFDITMGPLIKLWGWDTKSPHLPSKEAIVKGLKKTGIRRINCDPATHRIFLEQPGMSLDLGGIAKGFAVDRASELMRVSKLKNFIVNAGGDLYAAGSPPGRSWHIGIQDPYNPHAVFAVLSLTNRAIATSGDYEHYFFRDKIRYHHILNPKTGYPARGLRSVSVVAPTTMDADALATALFVMGREKAVRWLTTHSSYQGILMDSGHHIYASSSLKTRIKWKKKFKSHIIYF